MSQANANNNPQMSMWNAILQWSMRQTDGTSRNDLKPLSSEDRAFLDRVFRELVVDPIDKMKQLIVTLKVPDSGAENIPSVLTPAHALPLALPAPSSASTSTSSTSSTPEGQVNHSTQEIRREDVPELHVLQSANAEQKQNLTADIEGKKLAALQELDDLVGLIDTAKDFCKLGGLAPLLSLQEHKSVAIRSAALQTLSTVVQNNPHTQEVALNHGALPKLMENLQPNTHEDVIAKTLLALSSLTGSHQAAAEKFIKAGGYQHLLNLLSNPQSSLKVKRKSLFFLQKIWQQPPYHHLPNNAAIIPVLASFICHDDVDLREGVLKVMIQLIDHSPSNLAQLRTPHFRIRDLLSQREVAISNISDAEEKSYYNEELTMIRDLLRKL